MKTLFTYLSKNKPESDLSATYNIGLLQTKAFKAVMGTTAELLAKLKITNTEWVALGTIFDHSNGLRALSLAKIMDVEQAFISVLASKLAKRGLVIISADPTDKRAKIIHLSKEGKTFVKQTESMLIKELDKISAGITQEEAENYFKVLKSIVDYSPKDS